MSSVWTLCVVATKHSTAPTSTEARFFGHNLSSLNLWSQQILKYCTASVSNVVPVGNQASLRRALQIEPPEGIVLTVRVDSAWGPKS